jgi:putative tricarboxylic transport membrane protein
VNPAGFQRWQGIVAGGVLLLLGCGICIGTFSVGTLPGQDSLGPRLFPLLIGIGLAILGVANIWRGLAMSGRGMVHEEAILIPGSEVETSHEPGDWPTLLWVVASLVIGAAGYKLAGFIPSAWIVFLFTARGFAGHWSWRHALIGLIVVVVAFVGFTKGLGLHLPTGILSSVLGGH